MKKLVRCSGVITVFLLLAGCPMIGGGPFPPDYCVPPTTENIDTAFSDVFSSLTHPECQTKLNINVYWDVLLDIAAGNPGVDNLKKFEKLVATAVALGIIDRVAAIEKNTRYFNSTFVSLPTRITACQASTRNPDQLERDLRAELKSKEKGIRFAAGQEQRYLRARRDYDDLILFLDAFERACAN